MEKHEHVLRDKILYTCLMVLVYLIGKNIPLYMIDLAAYAERTVNSQLLLEQTISGDINQSSLFALGVSPYMISSILVQIAYMFRNTESKKKTSPIKKNRLTIGMTLVMAVVMAAVQVRELKFRVTGEMLVIAEIIAALEMVVGAFCIIYLISRIKRYGVGGQTTLIFMNVIDGIIITLQGHDVKKWAIPLLLSLIVMWVMLFMENTEKRIPVQRISIHNIYSDKNYLAIKLNPIGVMPVMFSAAFFMLPQLAVSVLGWFIPENAYIVWLQDNMTLSRPFGIAIYAVVLFILTVGFSRVMIHPGEITDNLLKSGDSLQDLHAGRDTKKYLSGVITRLSLMSAGVMSLCLCIPMILQLSGELESTFATLPSSIMMLTGMWCNLFREVSAIRDLESYKSFI